MTHHGGRHCTFFTVKKHDLAITSWNRICTASCTDAKFRVHVPITPVTISHPTYMPLCNGTSSSSLFNTQRVQFYYLQMHYHYRIQTSINMLINTSSNSTSLFRPHTGKGVKVKIWTLAIVPLTSDSWPAVLYNLGSGSWLAWAHGAAAHYVAIHCPR